jgi:hypothetical protein
MDNLDLLIGGNHKYLKITDDAERDALAGEFLNACRVFALLTDAQDQLNIRVDENAVAEIVERVRMRKLYFYIYHSIDDINSVDEIKITALYVFWILKLHPFFWKDGYTSKGSKSGYEINAKVALNLFLSGINLYADEKTMRSVACGGNDGYKISITQCTPAVLNELYYSFCYRDWSKEALMDFAKSLVIKYTLSSKEHQDLVEKYNRKVSEKSA